MLIRSPMPILLFVALTLAACRSESGRSDAEATDRSAEASIPYTDIDPAQLDEMMRSKDFLLVNVHIPYEGEIPGTDLHIRYDEIDQGLDQLGELDAKIVLYCRSGRMSTTATNRLAELGYTNLYHLAGGMRAWTAAGYQLEQGEGGS
ncbi:MAG: rhodanese-like domain-containing protein [Gemmatimonadota bacterium]|nr:MAG: rhodanese-like domain-containing protein [Gemmatimonadota bacterium]